MRIGRTLPPAAAPFGWNDLGHGIVGMFTPGRAAQTLRRDLQLYFDADHVFLVSSGTAALTLTLLALKDLSSRTDVVIPAYTCFSVPAAVLKAGLRPVLCDIGPSTFDLDPARLDRAITDRTLCVLAQHLFGIPSDLRGLRALCRSRGALVVEDAAQAFGGCTRAGRLGTLGDVGIFSMGRGKNITCGSGGLVVTRSTVVGAAISWHYEALARSSAVDTAKAFAELVGLTVFGRPSLYWIPAGLPFLKLGQTIFPPRIPMTRLSGFKAGCLHHWRRHLSAANRRRTSIARLIAERLSLNLGRDATPFLRLPIRVETAQAKRQLHAIAMERGLGVSVAYPTAVSEIPEVRPFANGERFPNAEAAADTVVTLPTHHWVSARDRQAIGRCVGRFLAAAPDPGQHRRPS